MAQQNFYKANLRDLSFLLFEQFQLQELLGKAPYANWGKDEVNAVLAAGSDDLTDVAQRLEAIRTVRPTENFEPLAASFKRIQNILRQASFSGGSSVDAGRLEEAPETALHEEFLRVREAVLARRKQGDYAAALAKIASIRPIVDTFFDKVLVNAQDERIRQNRLALLSSLLSEFSTIADFSEIVVTTQ